MRAKAELDSGGADRLRYAALELRFAMEALTYDRAQAYAEEIPPSEYNTWQPKKLMEMLINIHPHADKDSEVRFGRQDAPGLSPAKLRVLGREKVFDLQSLKKHYDALGSYLHMPTLKQFSHVGGIDLAKLRVRCDQIVLKVEEALSSSVFNVTLGMFAHIDCMKCEKPVRKRFLSNEEAVDAECFHCGALYRVVATDENRVEWKPMQQQLKCGTSGCSETFFIWDHQIQVGAQWRCSGCQTRYRIEYAVGRVEDE